MVKRYVLAESVFESHMEEYAEGQYVLYNDYSALLEENERLKSRCSDIPAYRHSPDESGVMRPCAGGEWVSVEDYAGLREFYRNAGYTAADVATAAADGFRDGVRSVDLEQFRMAVESWKYRSECDMRRGYDVVGFEFLDSARATSLECSRLLALIDAHKGE